MERTSGSKLIYRVLATDCSYFGSAIAANMPMIKTTTNNSISVNPAFFPAGRPRSSASNRVTSGMVLTPLGNNWLRMFLQRPRAWPPFPLPANTISWATLFLWCRALPQRPSRPRSPASNRVTSGTVLTPLGNNWLRMFLQRPRAGAPFPLPTSTTSLGYPA